MMVALTRHRIDLILDPSIVECCRSRDLSENYQLRSLATSASIRKEKWAMKRDGLPEYKFVEASRSIRVDRDAARLILREKRR